MTSTPVPITATVTPPALSAPRCAAASMPRARPLTTTTPARPSSSPSCSATASPYGDGLRERTIATRAPSGGGHRPRARGTATGRSFGGGGGPGARGWYVSIAALVQRQARTASAAQPQGHGLVAATRVNRAG